VVPNSASEVAALLAVERVVVVSVAITARALAEVAPELTFVQWRVLVLVDQPEGLAVGAVASALGAKMAAASRLVGRLRNRGLVETHRSAADARIVLVGLTPLGANLRNRVVRRRLEELGDVLTRSEITDEHAAAMERFAGILEAAM
jgi:DNA-binding MarR family transcriptional regulator